MASARRSKIPVLQSKEYKSRSTEVREKRLAIEAKEVELSVLKHKLSKLTLEQQGTRPIRPNINIQTAKSITPSSPLPLIRPEASAAARRTTITTPKGTKRKGTIINTTKIYINLRDLYVSPCNIYIYNSRHIYITL